MPSIWIGSEPLPAATEALPIRLDAGQLESAASATPLLAAAAASRRRRAVADAGQLGGQARRQVTSTPFSSWLPSERAMLTANWVKAPALGLVVLGAEAGRERPLGQRFRAGAAAGQPWSA